MLAFLDRLFHLQAHQSTVRKELVAGLTTFAAMAYILVVNPSMLDAMLRGFGVFKNNL